MKYSKKKIRGWNNKIKQLHSWKINVKRSIRYELENNSRLYYKIHLSSFLSLTNYKIPTWYKKLIVNNLIVIYNEFEANLGNNDKYYLKIWLFENDILRSQVVYATNDYFNFYDKTFNIQAIKLNLPPTLSTSESNKMKWDQAYSTYSISDSDFNEYINLNIYTEEEVIKLKKNCIEKIEHGDDYLYFYIDDYVYLSN